MGTRTISICDDAYERLSRLEGPSNMSFSEVILKYTPPKKKLSEILKEFGSNPALADSVAEASREMRKASMPTLDTSFLIDLIRHDPEAMRTLEVMERQGLPLATTAINALELYRGAFLSTSVQENLRAVEAITRALIELPITEETYRIFGTLAAELRGNGRPIGDFDEVIAAITLAGDDEIVTRNGHFTRVPGLKVRRY